MTGLDFSQKAVDLCKAMHKAMRADSQRLSAAAAALPDGDTGAAAALGRAFAAIVGLIHDHHWTEDDVMYPFLLTWTQTLSLSGPLRVAEPKTLRLRLVAIAGRLTRSRRRTQLRLDRRWP